MATWKKVLFEGEGGAGDHLFNANLTMPGGVTRSHTISSGSTFDINGPVGADFFLSQGQIRLGDSDFGGTINLQRSNSSVNVLNAEVQVDTEVVDINTHEMLLELESNPGGGAGVGSFIISQTEEGNTDPRPRLVMQKLDPAPAVSGVNALGGVFFQGYNTINGDINEQKTYVQVRGFADDTTTTKEDGRFEVRVADSGVQSEGALSVNARTDQYDDLTAIKIYGNTLRSLMTPTLLGPWTHVDEPVNSNDSEMVQTFLGSSLGTNDTGHMGEMRVIRDCYVTGVSYNVDVSTFGTGSTNINFFVYKNGSSAGSFGVFTDATTDYSGGNNVNGTHTVNSPGPSGSISFSAGDSLGLYVQYVNDYGTTTTYRDLVAFLEISYA